MPRHVEPSSLACMHCFKAKSKCVGRPDGQGCERCFRLKKQCRPSDSVRKHANAQRRQGSAARIGALEEKVDSLVKLLSLVSQSPAIAGTLDEASWEHESLADQEQPLHHGDRDWSSGTPDAAIEPMDDVTPHGRSSSGLASRDEGVTIESLANHDGTLPEAAQHLATFRDTMLPSFSFTDLPATVTVEQLQHDRPFFLCAVLAVATPFKSQKVARGRRFKETLIQAALIENQSSLDLLQGLLVFIAWGYDHMHTPCSTPSRLMMVAISLACDLRFDKPLPSDEHMMKPMVDDAFEQQHGRSNNWFVAEEQRAVLACYALSSIISIYFAQIDAMKWKPRMDDSLRAMEANPTDKAFAFQVRLQQLAQKAVQFREQRESDFARAGLDPGPALSANFYIRTLQSQVHQLSDALPSQLQDQATLTMHKHYIELCVNETARNLYLHANPGTSIAAMTTPNLTEAHLGAGPTFSIDELDFSWRSVGAIKAWMNAFFALSPAKCAGLSFIHMAQLARCLMVLYKLSTLVHPGWDCALLRATLDILTVLDGVARNLELASEEVGEKMPEDQFMYLAGQMRKFRDKAASRMGPDASSISDGLLPGGGTDSIPTCGVEAAAAFQEAMLFQPAGTGDLDSIFQDFGDGWQL